MTLDDEPVSSIAQIKARIESEPDNLKAKAGLALFWLSEGNFKDGWPQFKWQLKADPKIHYDDFPVPLWDGNPLAGKNVLVWLDRGIGDQILEASILPDLIAVAGSVTLLCSRRLVPLFRRSFPSVDVYKIGERVPARLKAWDFDCQLSIADLGTAFRPSLNFEGKPHLKDDLVKTARFREKYSRDGKRIIGLSWWTKNDITGQGKSLRLADLEHVLTWPNTTFVSLQYGDNAEEIAEVKARFGVEIIEDRSFNQLTDIDTFAAQVAALDGVVTSSNTTAHVAGGLGVPGIVMLPKGRGRFWYWHAKRTDSPWYPSLKLIRQATEGRWEFVTRMIGIVMIDHLPKRDLVLPEVTPDETDPRDKRILELEDALQEFAVFASAAEVPLQAEFVEDTPPEVITAFKRDTRYCDMGMFYRAAQLTRGLR